MAASLAAGLSLYIASHFPDALLSDVEFLTRGFESEIHTFQLRRAQHRWRSYILRLFTGEGAAEKLVREAKALSLLRNAGYPVPVLLLQESNAAILGKPFEIIERLEGQALWPVLASVEPAREAELLSRFGALLAQLHQLDWRSFIENPAPIETSPGLLLDETISRYRSLYTKHNLTGFLRLTDWLAARRHEISVRPAVVHQDFHANNVFLCQDDRLVVLDWTQFAVSDFRIDLAWTLLLMSDFGNPDWGRQIIDSYASHSVHEIEAMEYFHVLVSMKLLASTVISLIFGPEAVGLGPETVNAIAQQKTNYEQLSRRIQSITGFTIPELERVFG